MKMMEHQSYFGTIEYSPEDHCLFGKLAFIRDLVTYEAETIPNLEAEFQSAVEDYLADCTARKITPNTPCKGVFNVRTGPELHRAAVIAAKDQSLNAFVCEALQEKVERCAQHP